MTFSPKIIISTAAFGLCLAFGTASAQDSTSKAPAAASSSIGQMGQGRMHDRMMGHDMMRHDSNGSMHTMPATVSSVDGKTGIVEASSAGMSLRVHFPPASVANLKVGDEITLHMGYTR